MQLSRKSKGIGKTLCRWFKSGHLRNKFENKQKCCTRLMENKVIPLQYEGQGGSQVQIEDEQSTQHVRGGILCISQGAWVEISNL